MSRGDEEATVLYLIRHGATEANQAHPPRIQGRAHNPPLAPLGIRQAEATRDFLFTTRMADFSGPQKVGMISCTTIWPRATPIPMASINTIIETSALAGSGHSGNRGPSSTVGFSVTLLIACFFPPGYFPVKFEPLYAPFSSKNM